MGIREKLLAAVDDSPLSDRKLSMLATATPDTIRNIRRGTAPRADTLEALCEVLGVDLKFGPPLQAGHRAFAARPPTRFNAKVTLPVRCWADCLEEGYLSRPDDSDQAPAPVDLSDQHAFYAQVPGPWMVPGGIGQSDYCLISPFAQLAVDQRAWFRKRTGQEAIKWVMRLPPEVLDLGAWEPPDSFGHQRPVADRWSHGDVVDRGVVVDVYHERPSVKRPLAPAAVWRPHTLADLWRSTLFSSDKELEAAVAVLDKTVSFVEETQMRFKRLAARGALSESQCAKLLRALEEELLTSVRSIRASIAASPVGGDGGTPDGVDD